MSNFLDLGLCTSANIAKFTAGTFNFLQESPKIDVAQIIINQIEQMFGRGSYDPHKCYILNGLELAVVGSDYHVEAGAIFYAGEVYTSEFQVIPVVGSNPLVTNLLVTPYTTSYGGDPMIFSVTGPSNAHNIRTIQFVTGTSGSGTLNPSGGNGDYNNFILLSINEQSSNSIAISTSAPNGGVTGTFYYKKYFYSNTLHIRSTLTVNNPYNLVASPAVTAYTLGTLPSGFFSSNVMFFIAQATVIDATPNYIQDDLNIQYIRQINCSISNTGNIRAFFIKPDAGVTLYQISFDCVLCLD